MRTILPAILLAAALAPAVYAQHFGAPFTDAKTVALADAMAKPEELEGRAVKIEGTIKDVCQTKGCWLVIADGAHAMRVSFKDYKYFVPKESVGRRVVLEGRVARKTIPEAAAKHYAEESGTPEDAEKITGDQEVVTMVADGVEIQ